ncbi:MAG: AAA family ATPase [Pseudomonadota bacterium]
MRILKISGKNLASLAGEFTVDFEQEPLASAGLFAISGPTGAGKSTLLDALCLALYDATPRLLRRGAGSQLPDVGAETVTAQDPRSLLRRGAAEASAEVDFVGNDGGRYRANWSVRRAHRRASGALQSSAMTLHRLPELAALGGTKTEVQAEIVQRIGLSFEQFTRAVLLAQNEFSAFLKTEENERGALLETLTGSAIYSDISKRAHERYRIEQGVTAQLAMRLKDQTPLPADERAALDEQRAAADLALADIDARKEVLEQHLRWHQDAARLRQHEAQAELAITAATEQAAAADARRRALATLDAVQPARALVADSERLAAEQAALQAAMARGELAMQGALAAQAQAALAAVAAVDAVGVAEQAQRAAAPQLDRAKALDAAIAALAPAHGQAGAARDEAVRDAALAQEALTAKAAQLEQTRAARDAGDTWLAAHRQFELLAAQWPRWDKLLAQAGQGAAQQTTLAASLATAQQAAQRARAADAEARTKAEQAATSLAEAESARQQANAALAGFDADQMRAERGQLDARRESLAGGERIWSELSATRERLQRAVDQAARLAVSKAAAEAALAAALAVAAPLAAAAEQAERSLSAAELACADSVEDLRARLADDEPCPVCGSAEHPYQHQDARLHALLATLNAEVQRSRALLRENLAQQATETAGAEAAAAQLATVTLAGAALDESAAQLAQRWQAHASSAEAPAEDQRAEWFGIQIAALKEQAAQLDAREQLARQAGRAREAAQAGCDKAAAAHARLQAEAVAARSLLVDAANELNVLTDRREQAAGVLAALLEELDGAFEGDWQARWQVAPARFRAAREAEAQQWNEQSAQQARRALALGALEAEHDAARLRLDHARRIEAAAQAEFARIDLETGAMRRERGQLWDGAPVGGVEQALSGAIDAARAALAQQQAAGMQAGEDVARVREALAQNTQRREAIAAAVDAAATRVSDWVAAFPARHPVLDPIADLAALLAVTLDAMNLERAAIEALDAAVVRAATVLAERRAQREQHQLAAPADFEAGAEPVAAALAAVLAERKAAHDLAAGLRLAAAQDDARRAIGAAVLAEIETQQVAERRWGKLSELIGSPDGKKFRNYAQQFTLDVLLGYANSHLAELAKRYRLERIVNSGGPSLGLMVRDQDMGGEVRGVNSLSGGESFLVSLALALGLASLSSNRVRVESLFIDEGFGSLDSDTLRIAMDALDGLQSMGRKVGVISHVQEMTERIATRIMVQPGGGGSSSVTVQ